MPTSVSPTCCWACGSARNRVYKPGNYHRPLQPADLEVTDYRYGITLMLCACEACGFIYACGDDLRHLNQLYDRLEDTGYERTQPARTRQVRQLMDHVLRVAPRSKTLLDVGAGTGLLVREANTRGLDAIGIEPSRAFVRSAAQLNHVQLLRGRFPHPELEGRLFDVITMVDLIEHVPDPLRLLCDAASALAAKGLLVVTTPDVGSLCARIFGHRWWHFRLAHVGYFTRQTLIAAAARADLQPVDMTRPTWFFPIEYLACRLEQYLPLKSINQLIARFALGRWFYDRVIPIAPRDSMTIFFARSG